MLSTRCADRFNSPPERSALRRFRRHVSHAHSYRHGAQGPDRLPYLRHILRWILIAAFVVAGYFHIAHPEPFMRITPAWVPSPRETIFLTGLCEFVGALGLAIPRARRIAGLMLGLYSVCVFPANVQHALLYAQHGNGWTGWLYHGPRLLFQPVIVWWCLFAGEVTRWPFTMTGRAA
jgi:uncharacterized membrane protein